MSTQNVFVLNCSDRSLEVEELDPNNISKMTTIFYFLFFLHQITRLHSYRSTHLQLSESNRSTGLLTLIRNINIKINRHISCEMFLLHTHSASS